MASRSGVEGHLCLHLYFKHEDTSLKWCIRAQAYHKANEERKLNVTELNAVRGTIEYMRQTQSQRDGVDSSAQFTPRAE